LNRPQRLNALNGPMPLALRTAVEECSAPARGVRVIVVQGEGRAFCSRSDLKWVAERGVLNNAAAHLQNQDRMQAAYESLEAARQAVIPYVQGYAVAGGPELELPLRDGLALERRMQFRYRTESPAIAAGVHKFAAEAGVSRPTAAHQIDTGEKR
jgi:1,4-dihydroxy-2-naphthoyl-CoA synthase